MKTFTEEYGRVIVVAIIICALIGVACVCRTSGMESIKGIWKNFMEKSELGLAISDSESSGGGSSEEETPSGPMVKTDTFTIVLFKQQKTLQLNYEEGMTWEEWAQSDYAKGTELEGVYFKSGQEIVMNPTFTYSTAGGAGTKESPYRLIDPTPVSR